MKTILCIVTAVVLCGCYSVGHKIDTAKVEQIKAGETTREQVLQMIGSPDSTTTTDKGKVTFTYRFILATAKAERFIPVFGAFAGGANVQHEMVIVTFTNNVVSGWVSSAGATDSGYGASSASTNETRPVPAGKRVN